MKRSYNSEFSFNWNQQFLVFFKSTFGMFAVFHGCFGERRIIQFSGRFTFGQSGLFYLCADGRRDEIR